MDYPYTENFWKNNKTFMLENMMGPNSMRVSEEMASFLPLDSRSRVLDLGCGAGLSSIFLAERYGAQVFASDLWISPDDNVGRFDERGLGDKIIPMSVDANAGLPFAHGYFDILFSVDAYHYFGVTGDMLPSLAPFVKRGGYIAVAVPGLKKEFINGMPRELRPFVPDDANFHSVDWWVELWSKAEGIELVTCREMECHGQAWKEWLQSPNPYAVGDIDMMEAEGGRYFNHVQLIAKRL